MRVLSFIKKPINGGIPAKDKKLVNIMKEESEFICRNIVSLELFGTIKISCIIIEDEIKE